MHTHQEHLFDSNFSRKLHTWAGAKFIADKDRPFIIVRALYGLKSSGT